MNAISVAVRGRIPRAGRRWRIRQFAERDLARSLDVMADDFGTGVRDDHLVLLGHHVNPLADQRFRHQVASRAEPNAAAFFNLALFARA
jgi:hypothetical protein